MTASTGTPTLTDTDIVRAVFQAFAGADAAALGGLLHADATWNHRNNDRPGGVHRGTSAILAYLAESAQLTGGTLRAVPQSYMADGQGRVGVLVRLGATRPTAARWTARRSCWSPSTAAACEASTSSSETPPP